MSILNLDLPKKFEPLLQKHRYKVFYGGRGASKSWAFARVLLAIGVKQRIRVLCAREVQKSIRESVHKLLSDQIQHLGLEEFYTVTDTSIKGPNGTDFFFAGLHRNIDSIKSIEGIDIVWVEEAQSVSEESWSKLIPTIRKPGSEIWVSFNPDQKVDATYQRFIEHPPPDSVVVKVSWRDNPWFTEELRAEMEHLKAVDYEEYLHIWEGDLRNYAQGAIYQKQLREARDGGRICHVPIQPACEVNTFWDLGKNDTTAIWFHQRVGPENRFIDYYENRLVDLDHYIRVLRDKGYIYGTHYLPHDVEFDMLGMVKTRREQLEDGGVKPISVVPRVNHINEGIEMTRQAFASCWFDEDRCEQGLDALANYQFVFDETYNVHRRVPLHNWASNGADAFRQFAQGYTRTAGWGSVLGHYKKPMSERRQAKMKSRFSTDASWRV